MKWRLLTAGVVLVIAAAFPASAARLLQHTPKAIDFSDSLGNATATEYSAWIPLVTGGGQLANLQSVQAFWNTSAGTGNVFLYAQFSFVPSAGDSPQEWNYSYIYQINTTAATSAATVFSSTGSGTAIYNCVDGKASLAGAGAPWPGGIVARYVRFKVTGLNAYTGTFQLDVLLAGG